jgi:phosphatidylserine/phosphatidylglycerophosphate/cardiolipin synthase-like enzyme
MKGQPKAYFKGIEKKIIELISNSNNMIKIAMAWFTNNDIKESLINQKNSNPEIKIIIVVDDNYINDEYFSNYESKFREAGIKIEKKASDRFLHNKFMIIDETITVTGSYNYSKKANTNLENIVVIDSVDFSSYYSRIFEFLINSDYVDGNIKILLENQKFAQEILSTYYDFNKAEYLKYKEKIDIGDCFTHDNGMYDEIKYSPGLIFNPKISFSDYKKSEFFEFEIPVNKNIIKLWVKSRNMNLIIGSYSGSEVNYDLINDELENSEKAVENFFKRKLENTYQYVELKKMIENGVDIILEDDLWINNFEPFINKKNVEKIFEGIEKIEEKNYF